MAEIIQFRQRSEQSGSGDRDDDEIILHANEQITAWQAAGTPSLTAVQQLFYESIGAGASSMARDRIIDAIIAAFEKELGGKRALVGTWNKLAKDFAAECAQEARNTVAKSELTPEEKTVLRDALWPTVQELAQAPDLIDRVVHKVQSMGVVNERNLITLTYIGATSRVLPSPINILAKGASSGGKSFTITHALDLVGPDYVNKLTSSSALSLVYDTRSLAHTVIFV